MFFIFLKLQFSSIQTFYWHWYQCRYISLWDCFLSSWATMKFCLNANLSAVGGIDITACIKETSAWFQTVHSVLCSGLQLILLSKLPDPRTKFPGYDRHHNLPFTITGWNKTSIDSTPICRCILLWNHNGDWIIRRGILLDGSLTQPCCPWMHPWDEMEPTRQRNIDTHCGLYNLRRHDLNCHVKLKFYSPL